MPGNSNLHVSSRNKQDEFYTNLQFVEDELKHHRDHIKKRTNAMNRTTFLTLILSVCAACAGAETFRFASGDLRLVFRDNGRVAELKDTAGRKYLATVSPWVSRIEKDGKWVFAEKAAKREDGALAFTFADGTEVVESVEPFDGGFAFTVVGSTVPDGTQSLILALMRPDCSKYMGSFACIASDDERAVCLRSFDHRLGMSAREDAMKIELSESARAKGMRFGLAAGPRDGILVRLQELVRKSGLSYSEAGGPWSLGSKAARQSYIFANMTPRNDESVSDAWIDMVRRSGASVLHIHCFEESLGHYGVNKAKYPGGVDQLKAVADRARAAGLDVSIHSLTGCISFYDPWVTPVAHSNLIATYTYTLAQPLTKDSTEVVVEELPGPKHDVVTTYTSNGNVLAIDGELITYTGIRREKPYAFTGIIRGKLPYMGRDLPATAADHPAGAKVKYLQQRYFCYYPEPDSPLAVELADSLAGVYNAIGANMIYFDGSEGMKSTYGTAKMASLIVDRLSRKQGAPHIEMSCTNPHFWPFRCTMGAWDNVRFGAKSFEDLHIRANVNGGRKTDFLDGQMGWWAPQLASKAIRSRFPDETEYFAAKNAGYDFAMSLQGIDANAGFIPDLQEKAVTLIGWYERFRLARAFAPDVQKELATLGHEGELRQNPKTGAWEYAPLRIIRQRILGEGVGDRWTCRLKKAVPATLRIETFYNLSPFESPAATKVFDGAAFASAKRVAAGKASIAAAATSDPERGDVTRLTAFNDTGATRGAWAGFERTWEGPKYFSVGQAAGIGFWVKGDGSGAILNVQLEHPRIHDLTHADNLVKLDFKGWRYVELLFRERDVDEISKYVWPHKVTHPEYMNRLQTDCVSAVRVYLNEIPVSASEGVLDSDSTDAAARNPSVDILLSEIKALGLKETTAEDVKIKLNGQKVELPFEEIAAGDWAELEDGVWTLYDEKGGFKERAAGPRLTLKAGENKFRYSADVSGRAAARAEVKVFVRAKPMPALADLTAEQRKALAWEAEMPAHWVPAKGADALPSVKVRPGEKAKLAVKVRGPVADPVLTVNGQTWKLASVPAKAVRTFTDGPVVSGVVDVKLESSDPTAADALVEFVKNYAE